MTDLVQAIASVKALAGGDGQALPTTEPPKLKTDLQGGVVEKAAGRFCTAFEAPSGELEFQDRHLGSLHHTMPARRA